MKTRTVIMHCTWTNEVEVEVPHDWDGRDPAQFVEQTNSRDCDLYDIEVAAYVEALT